MKRYLLALLTLPSGIVLGQIPSHFSPKTSTWVNVRTYRIPGRIRQQLMPPEGGFWVIEESPGCPAIAHFYAESRREIHADTLGRKHLNLRRRAMVKRLNERLAERLDASLPEYRGDH